MCKKRVFLLLQVILSAYCNRLDIFHTGSKVTFYPEVPAEYFGYSLLLNSSSLIVGAPKASFVSQGRPISGGMVFTCSVNNLDVANTTCGTFNDNARITSSGVSAYIKDDMWFGASLASLHGDLLICAPRWTSPYKDTHMLSNGVCFVYKKPRGQISLNPLGERSRQAFLTTGTRREYGEYGTHLNFYAYAQFGMSVKVTSNNSVIIGAPGLLQWTGGIIDYHLKPSLSKQPITNPYYTKELEPDNYFGYSVESGTFEPFGSVLYVAAAPRSKMGYGQVLIFEPARLEAGPLAIHETVVGPQLGSYFGASLACVDVNGDGRVDLLVGAPNYVAGDDLPFDQGAVFVYLNREVTDKAETKSFRLEEAGHVTGSGKHGARFGYAIADLGDVDGDGFRDIAIGAPWESSGVGAVYIYRGSKRGLQTSYTQRITAEGRGFGMAIASGLDLDGNKCNDLAVGAYASGSAYVYRCVPSLTVTASIKVPDAMDLPQNATNFTVMFCVDVNEDTEVNELWPGVKKFLNASIIVDSENQRAILSGDDKFTVIAEPGLQECGEQVVEVKPTADLSKPISLKFVLEPHNTMTADSLKFDRSSARLSDDCKMESSFKIQLTRDCGEDLICKPLLNMSLSALDSSLYVPGTQSKLGVRVTITNIDEPAYGAKVYIALPLLPIRVPTPCTLKELKLDCTVPAPLLRGAKVEWDVELEYTQNTTEDTELIIVGTLESPFQSVINNTMLIKVKPMASFNISGQSLPNVTVPVTRQKLYERGFVTITHYYEIINGGPSDWPELEALYYLPEMLSVTHQMKGCTSRATRISCIYSAPANESLSFILTLRFDLAYYGVLLEESMVVNFTTSLTLLQQNRTKEIMTSLVLEPAPSLWPLVIGLTFGIILAIGLLAAIIYVLHKNGFFSRRDRDKLKLLQDGATSEGPSEGPSGDPCGSTATMQLVETDESSQELLLEDSD